MKSKHILLIELLAILVFLAFFFWILVQIKGLGDTVRAADFKIDIARDTEEVTKINQLAYRLPEASKTIPEKTLKVISSQEVRSYVLSEAKKAELDVKMVERLVDCESHWNTNAISKSGRYVGLFQISPIHGMTVAQRQDYKVSTAWAIKQIKANGYKAWPHCGFIK